MFDWLKNLTKRGKYDTLKRENVFWGGEMPSNSGVSVNAESSLTYSAFYGAVDRIAADIGKLPIHVYERDDAGDYQRKQGHPVEYVMQVRPNDYQTPYIFKQTMQGALCRWGNAYAEIQWRADGRPAALHPINPDIVTVEMSPDGEYFYRVQTGDKTIRVAWENMLHVKLLGDGLVGKSPVALFRESLGMALAAERAGTTFFGQGMRPGAVLEHPGVLTDEAANRLRRTMEQQAGGSKNQGRLVLLEEGMKLNKWTIPPEDAQYLETRTFQVDEICRIFHLPPHKLAELTHATFSNVEELNREYVVDCLQPHLTNWEQEVTYKLFLPGERQKMFTRFSIEGLLRGNTEARAKFYAQMFNIGVMSINEIRALENMPQIDDGDKHYIPLNMTTTDAPELPAATPPPQPEPEGGDEDAEPETND